MKQIIKILFFCFFLLSCQEYEGHLNPSEGLSRLRTLSFSPEQRQILFPNELFVALANKKSHREIQEIIDKNGHYIFALNQNGDTPMGVAIQFYNLEGALFIAKQLSPKHYLHKNSKGEGYLYLASKKGYVPLIQLLANQFYKSKQTFFSDYEFSDLDMQTNKGERALHVAKNYLVAEALRHEYWRGSLEYPLRKFQYFQNNQGQSFLHTSIRDENSDLLRWGLKQNCMGKEKWGHQSLYYKYPSLLWRGIQMYGKPMQLDWDDLINTQDQEGETAINLSAKNRFFEGIKILSSCQWINYLLPDHKGNIPLQNFLLSLDPLKENHNEVVKEVFTLLMEQQTKLTWSGIADHINHFNKEGESSLHISARMVDSFFYAQLKKYGDIEQANHQEQTPREIFESKREQLKKGTK